MLLCLACPSGPPHAPVNLIFSSNRAAFEAVVSEFESDATLSEIKVWPYGAGCVSRLPDETCFGDGAHPRLVALLKRTHMLMVARKPYGIEFGVGSEARGSYHFDIWVVRHFPDAERPDPCTSWPPTSSNGVCRIDLDSG